MRNLINKQKNCLVAVLMLVVMSVSLVMPAKVFAAENSKYIRSLRESFQEALFPTSSGVTESRLHQRQV